MFLKLIYSILIIILTVFYFSAPEDMDKGIMIEIFIVAFISILLFAFKKEKVPALKGQFLKHSTLVIIGLVVVHFQYDIDYIIGNASVNDKYIWVDTNVVIKTLTLSVIGLLCFFLGYLSYKKRKKRTENQSIERVYNANFLLWVATFLLIGYFFTVNPLYLMGYYGVEQIGEEAGYIILFFKVVIFSIIIQNCRNIIVSGVIPASFKDYVKTQGLHLIILLGIYLLSVMISGDRGPLMAYGLAFISGYFFVTKKKLSLKQGLLFMFLGASVITILGYARTQDRSLSFNDKISESFNVDNRFDTESFLPQTQELATSVRALHAAVDYIPERHPYLYGRFQFQQLAVTLPFFSNFNPLLFEKQEYKYRSSSSFVTWINQGDNPYSGDGTTCIADFYFDFGIIGVIIGMYFFGFFIRFTEIKMYSLSMPTLFAHALLVVYLSDAIYISRSTVLIEIKAAVWIFIILVLNKHIFNKRLR